VTDTHEPEDQQRQDPAGDEHEGPVSLRRKQGHRHGHPHDGRSDQQEEPQLQDAGGFPSCETLKEDGGAWSEAAA